MTEHHRELEVYESTVEINETSYQPRSNYSGNTCQSFNKTKNYQGCKDNKQYSRRKIIQQPPCTVQLLFWTPGNLHKICPILNENANNPDCYAEVKSAKSTAEFIKNRTGNSARVNSVELEYLAELMDHPIEHVIHGINEFVFPSLEETNEPHM